jgi:hypothetical protein
MTTQPKISIDQVAGLGSEYDAGNSGSSKSIDWANGGYQKLTLTANCAITLGTPAEAGRYQLRLIQNGSSAYTVTWAGTNYSASRWGGAAAAPTVNTIANGESIVSLFFDGTSFAQFMTLLGTA